ncbi:hypothetical protein ACFLQ9_01585 [Bacteroidota bacterium]
MRIIYWFIFVLIAFNFKVNAQCNNELIDLCLKDIGGATYLKEFPVKLKKGKKGKQPPFARFAVALKKGTQYRFNVKNDVANQSFAILTLSDNYTVYGSTYQQDEEKDYSTFDFYCKKTGTYYISFLFKDYKEGCAVGMLSMVDVFKIYH